MLQRQQRPQLGQEALQALVQLGLLGLAARLVHLKVADAAGDEALDGGEGAVLLRRGHVELNLWHGHGRPL